MKIPTVSAGAACLLPMVLMMMAATAGGQLATNYDYFGQYAFAYQSLVYEFPTNANAATLTLVGWQGTEPEGDPSVTQVIPSTLLIPPPPPFTFLPPQAFPVTSIGAGAFNACIDMPAVVIPATVTNIGDSAFVLDALSIYFLGNAPVCSPSAFGGWAPPGEYSCIAYYLPGTAGWSNTFVGNPTVLWTPQVQATGFSSGTNQFGFTVNGLTGLTVAVDASPSLVNPTWTPLASNTLTNDSIYPETSGSAYFSDPEWTNYPARFYRLRWP